MDKAKTHLSAFLLLQLLLPAITAPVINYFFPYQVVNIREWKSLSGEKAFRVAAFPKLIPKDTLLFFSYRFVTMSARK